MQPAVRAPENKLEGAAVGMEMMCLFREQQEHAQVWNRTQLIGLCCWEMSTAKKSQGCEETEVGFSFTHSEAQTFRIVLNLKNKVIESTGMRGRQNVGI